MSHLYIIVSSKVLYTHTLLKHRAGLYIELGGENKLIDTGPHDLKGRFVFGDNVKYIGTLHHKAGLYIELGGGKYL